MLVSLSALWPYKPLQSCSEGFLVHSECSTIALATMPYLLALLNLIHPHQRCGYSDSPFARKDTFLYCRLHKGIGEVNTVDTRKDLEAAIKLAALASSRLDHGFQILSKTKLANRSKRKKTQHLVKCDSKKCFLCD